MRILLLTHSFNSLSQRFYVELSDAGHDVSIEFDINDSVTREAVDLFRPDLIVAPFLKRRIPEDIWSNHLCIVVHPGIKGDRGPSALDWAVQEGEKEWGVTLLQAEEEMDAGHIWSSESFPMREASKSSLYRNEVTDAAVRCLWQVIERMHDPSFEPEPLDYSQSDVSGKHRPFMKQSNRSIDWTTMTTDEIVRRIRAADGFPGLYDESFEIPVYLYNAWPEDSITGKPGELIARRDGAICRAAVDGAVWIGHMKKKSRKGEREFKLPAAMVLGDKVKSVPEMVSDPFNGVLNGSFGNIRYEERGGVGYLYFPFYNGAMGTLQCRKLLEVYYQVRERPVQVVVLMGGSEFWSNGMNLNLIEAADSPADESWQNINMIDDLAREIIETTDKFIIVAMEGNAGAGGVFLALAADMVMARDGVVLNPHYKSMGNLYGSEYWTYLLPRRCSSEAAEELIENRLPVSAKRAQGLGLVDEVFPGEKRGFRLALEQLAEEVAGDPLLGQKLKEKARNRARDEKRRPLNEYREQELEGIRLNFYGFDPSYHVARFNFVTKRPRSRTPFYLAKHRQLGWQIPKVERDEAAGRVVNPHRRPADTIDK